MKQKIKIDGVWVNVKTSNLENDGSDGVHPFITSEYIPEVDLSEYQKIIDPTLETVAQTIPSAINEVRGIAIGANKAFVFDTEADMEAWLLIPENVALLITGNLLLIRELTVPDYWWDGTQALELEVKIDLTNYYTKLESDNRYSLLTHRHTGETITPDVINITKTFTQAEIDLLAAGSFFWDDANQTYAFKTPDGGTIQINQEPHGYYVNLEGAAIVQMNVVSTTGATGNRTAVKLTDSTSDLLSNACIGMVTVPSIGDNNTGRITKSGGKVNELNTDVVGWVEGDTLYVNPLLKGTLTNVMPVAPDRIIKVGTLLVKHANVGVIDLQIQVMPKLNELVDGTMETAVDADELLIKENATGIWKRLSFTNFKTFITTNWSLIWAKEQSFTLGVKTDIIKKLNGSGLFALQDGGTIWHTTKWFTPTVASTASSVGTLVTLTGSTQLTTAMIGGKFGFGDDKRIILTVPTTSTCTVDSAFSQDYVGVAAVSWGVYGRFLYTDSNGNLISQVYNGTATTTIITQFGTLSNSGEINVGVSPAIRIQLLQMALANNYSLLWSATTASNGTKDLGLNRFSAGLAQIYDGITSGTYRDLILRTIYAEISGRFGGASNNVLLDALGVHLTGTATVFEDLTADITRAKTVGARVTFNDAESTLDFTNACTLTDYVVVTYQMSHKWKLGSVVFPHIHWEKNSANTPNWLIQYRWQINGGAKVTAWTNYKCNVNAFTYVSGILNQICYDGGLTPPVGASLSDIVELRIIRDTANTSGVFTGVDNYVGVASITAADIHYEIDTLGSNTEYTK